MGNARIIVAVDLDGECREITAGSSLAALEARRLAQGRATTVELLHSTYFDRPSDQAYSGAGWGSWPIPTPGREALGRLVRAFSASGATCELILVETPPVVALCRAARRPGTEWIVIGRHNGIEPGSRIGSVCERMLHLFPAPLWIVTPRASVPV